MNEIFFLNLADEVREYLSNSGQHIDVFAPFITVDALSQSLSTVPEGVTISIITRWKIIDFLLGSASFELFDFCTEKGLTLYINPRLHLKTFVKDYQILLLGSANLTGRGLGLVQPDNHEFLACVQNSSSNYLLFLEQIKADSALVTTSVISLFEKEIEKLKTQSLEDLSKLESQDDKLYKSAKKRDFFLISELPMCADIDLLFRVVQNPDIDLDTETLSTARHDIIKYALLQRKYKSKAEFKKYLTHQFLLHPFIHALCDFIDRPRRFGEVRAWVQSVCTDVPVPARRSLSGNVNVLYNWLVTLGEEQFTTFRPNHTEFIAPRN